MRLKCPPFNFVFSTATFFNFSVSKGPPLTLLKSRLVISGIKRYIRTFEVIFEPYCAFVRRERRSENRGFSWKRPTHISNLRFLSLVYGSNFRRCRLLFLEIWMFSKDIQKFRRGCNSVWRLRLRLISLSHNWPSSDALWSKLKLVFILKSWSSFFSISWWIVP